MPRTLRTRTSRPNYAAMFQENEDGPEGAGSSGSKSSPALEDEDSGSDFALEPQNADEDDEDAEHSEEDDEDVDEIMTDAPARAPSASDFGVQPSSSKRKRKAPAKSTKNVSIHAPSAPRASRQSVPLGAPSLNHRHRPIPIYTKAGQVERLAAPPALFGRGEVVLTNAWGSSVVAQRVSKAWGYNVGQGPLWELLEDRGWFPEAQQGPEGQTDAQRRPKVHADIHAGPYEILSFSYVMSFWVWVSCNSMLYQRRSSILACTVPRHLSFWPL